MLIGEYTTQVGDKNRVAIPKKLRDELEGKIFITRGYERCLLIVDQQRWNALLKVINYNPLLSISVRDTKRYILGGATEIEPDNQGRFVVPEQLLKFANIQTKLTFLGVGEWIEVWDEDKWNSKLEALSSNVADLAERLKSI